MAFTVLRKVHSKKKVEKSKPSNLMKNEFSYFIRRHDCKERKRKGLKKLTHFGSLYFLFVEVLPLKIISSSVSYLFHISRRYKISAFSALFQPGVNFIKVLRAAFARADPKSAKKTVKLSVFFALLGSAHIKASRKIFGETQHCLTVHNVLQELPVYDTIDITNVKS